MVDGTRNSPTDSSSISSTLLARVKEKDSSAWERMVALYSPLVYRWTRQAGLQSSDAADVVQEVFRSVWNHIENFRREHENDTFRGWLWTITRSRLLDHFRRVKNRPQAVGGTTMQARVSAEPEVDWDAVDALGVGTESELFHRALELIRVEFEERTWQAFWKTAAEGRAATEVAEELGISPGAVRQAKYRILTRLRLELDDRT